jgi:hypothetical protein
LRDKLIKIGAKVVSHSRYVIFQMAEVAIARQMPVWDSSGESRLNRQNVLQRLNQQTGIVSDVPVLLNVEEQPRSTRGVDPTRLKRTVRETPLRVRGAA